jgi:hypothetical protein
MAESPIKLGLTRVRLPHARLPIITILIYGRRALTWCKCAVLYY